MSTIEDERLTQLAPLPTITRWLAHRRGSSVFILELREDAERKQIDANSHATLSCDNCSREIMLEAIVLALRSSLDYHSQLLAAERDHPEHES